jgi:tRNA (uracil-5-)-methyltransferase
MFQVDDHGRKQPEVIQQLAIAHPAINQLMPRLLAIINQQPDLQQHLFQVEFLANLAGDVLVSLIYRKHIAHAWLTAAETLTDQLAIHIVGRSRNLKLVVGQDYLEERFQVGDRQLVYRQAENGFSQPNAYINGEMLNWAEQITRPLGGDLLELYCGNGNFTVALATNFNKVLATEISKVTTAVALHNLQHNQVTNVKLVRMASGEVSDALADLRVFRRLQLQQVKLTDYQFTTLLVDPPRAGLDSDTVQMARGFNHILYISCNPDSLVENLKVLNRSHRIDKIALFDQFPFTPHIECGLLLTKLNPGFIC